MKLVDILALELKVWPDQYYQIYQDSGGHLIGTLSNGDLEDCDQDDLPFDPVTIAWDGNNAVIERAEWQAAVDALNADRVEYSQAMHVQRVGRVTRVVAWDGEGRPPVGTVCEAQIPSKRYQWERCEIVWHHPDSDGSAAVVHGDGKLLSWSSTFRAIRTPEQIAAEERDKAVSEMLELDPYLPNTTLGMMSRADFCRKLYDENYRKQVAK